MDDVPRLLPLLEDFYRFEHLPYDAARSEWLLSQLISDPHLGRVVLFEEAGELAGYMVLTFGFSLEFHGRDALIDEFYVRPESRCRGIGEAALNHAKAMCRALRIAAVHLEADHFNTRGHAFYKRQGFADHPRHLMTHWL